MPSSGIWRHMPSEDVGQDAALSSGQLLDIANATNMLYLYLLGTWKGSADLTGRYRESPGSEEGSAGRQEERC
nr:hypothetical protein CFP56_22208 [Quercus suber]